MAKMKITFRKEIWVDLNEYYPNFSSGLRKQIDNTIYKLLGGQEKPIKKQPTAKGLVNGVVYRWTKKLPSKKNTKTEGLLKDLQTAFKGDEWLKDDIIKLAVQRKINVKTALADLIRGGYLELVE